MIVRSLPVLLILALFGTVVGCGQRGGSVYVLEEPQSVTLTASVSTLKVQQGGTVVLHAERRTSGKWKQISLNEVRAGQCWVYRPPVESEPEVADALQWEVVPENAATFNREYRMDHTKIATMNVKGTITLTPRSAVQCEPDRVVEGTSIQIEVS
ncbi:MAG: hypothetical protein ACREV5_23255 [Steroidobacter sp.]